MTVINPRCNSEVKYSDEKSGAVHVEEGWHTETIHPTQKLDEDTTPSLEIMVMSPGSRMALVLAIFLGKESHKNLGFLGLSQYG